MNREQIIRAWKDEDYRLSLGSSELVALPAHPAGLIELTDLDMLRAAGGEEEITPTLVGSVALAIVIAFTIPIASVVVAYSVAGKCHF